MMLSLCQDLHYDIMGCINSANNIFWGIRAEREVYTNPLKGYNRQQWESLANKTTKPEVGSDEYFDEALEDNFEILKKYGSGEVSQFYEGGLITMPLGFQGEQFSVWGCRLYNGKEFIDLLSKRLKEKGAVYD